MSTPAPKADRLRRLPEGEPGRRLGRHPRHPRGPGRRAAPPARAPPRAALADTGVTHASATPGPQYDPGVADETGDPAPEAADAPPTRRRAGRAIVGLLFLLALGGIVTA